MAQRMSISCQFITSDGSRGRSLRDWHRHQQDLGPQAWLEWSLPGKIINVFVFRIALSQGWPNHCPGAKNCPPRLFHLLFDIFWKLYFLNYTRDSKSECSYKNSIPLICIPWIRQKNCTCVEVNSLYLTEANHPVLASACNKHGHQMYRLDCTDSMNI